MSSFIILAICVISIAVAVGIIISQVDESSNDTGKQRPAERPQKKDEVSVAIGKGLEWLVSQQKEDGYFGADEGPVVAITALCVTAIARSPQEYREKYSSQAEKAILYILKSQQSDGSISDVGLRLANYTTAISIMALAYWDFEKHKGVIMRARRYLEETQFSEDFQEIDRSKAPYGGWGYDKELRPRGDLSNTAAAIEALRIAGLPEDSTVWKRALVYLSRCQNRGESNDFVAATTNDGGFFYAPTETRGQEETLPDGRKVFKSYGSMTAQGLKSMIYAGLTKDDPRVQAAFNWICKKYTLDENPGLSRTYGDELGQQGLYYYYVAFSKALDAYGEKYIETADGKKRDWRLELTEKLLSLQKPEGYWVNDRNDRWMEGDPVLVTAYCIKVLNICRSEE